MDEGNGPFQHLGYNGLKPSLMTQWVPAAHCVGYRGASSITEPALSPASAARTQLCCRRRAGGRSLHLQAHPPARVTRSLRLPSWHARPELSCRECPALQLQQHFPAPLVYYDVLEEKRKGSRSWAECCKSRWRDSTLWRRRAAHTPAGEVGQPSLLWQHPRECHMSVTVQADPGQCCLVGGR